MASHLSFFFFLFFFLITAAVSALKEFQVGGAVGWRVPAANETRLYNVWSSRRRFQIGDSLRFRYKNDSVAKVRKREFYHCDARTPITIHNDGDTVIQLYTMGMVYFISGDHDRCKVGQNMKVEVMGIGLDWPHPPPEIPEKEFSGAVAPSEYVMTFSSCVSLVGVMVGVGLFPWKP